jgi:SMODS and SLOG-associating 2TM effector domain family 5
MSRDSPSRSPQTWHEHAAATVQGAFVGDGQRGSAYAPPPEPEMKAKLLADWQLVKRARFQAADRLGQRNGASLFTLSMVALYGGLITVFVLIFKDSLTPHMRSICDWVSVVANWLTLTFSLTEQIKDYSGQSRALHECAQKVNDLRKHLQATQIGASHQLIPFVKAYEAIISECGPNHERLDYEIGRLSGGRALDGMTAKATAQRLSRLRTWSVVSTYAIYFVMSLAPAIAGILAWLMVPVPVVAGQ